MLIAKAVTHMKRDLKFNCLLFTFFNASYWNFFPVICLF